MALSLGSGKTAALLLAKGSPLLPPPTLCLKTQQHCRLSSSCSSNSSSSLWGVPSGRCELSSTWRSHQYFRLAGGRKKSSSLFVLSKKKSGFAELFLQKRMEQQELRRKGPNLKPGVISPRLPVPDHIPRPPYVNSPKVPKFSEEIQIQDTEGITRMRAACELAARVRDYAGTLVKPGVTTDEIDKAVHKMIIDAGAYPSPLGYGGFPKSVCTSVNECICHGIPDSRPLQDGDVINIDVTVYLNGYHGDTSKTFLCGNVDDGAKRLVEVTRECLEKAIAICRPGVEYNKIGKTIEAHADKYKYGVVQKFIGHGVGKIFHSAPTIFHFRNDAPGRMQVGETFTIEPMLTQGSIDDVMWEDKWTYVTADGSLSAQFEHSLLITNFGAEILTV